ncbi:uncharacterized protein BJ171DRAFT_508454 [Polychytrium aggregatum]|uniref:uncharacterized protein n=1 Tax=Polychytrium aggregatum TaxID=110093 RepID=UPI0022FF0BFA|nr:uncharacterized protein BJ171DRAFT_508454 [Polychytrium aggregatum]KAI9203860.1 hypothetical protein BJ171DRAFT_508454 [Polychytrium aggregatum]
MHPFPLERTSLTSKNGQAEERSEPKDEPRRQQHHSPAITPDLEQEPAPAAVPAPIPGPASTSSSSSSRPASTLSSEPPSQQSSPASASPRTSDALEPRHPEDASTAFRGLGHLPALTNAPKPPQDMLNEPRTSLALSNMATATSSPRSSRTSPPVVLRRPQKPDLQNQLTPASADYSTAMRLQSKRRSFHEPMDVALPIYHREPSSEHLPPSGAVALDAIIGRRESVRRKSLAVSLMDQDTSKLWKAQEVKTEESHMRMRRKSSIFAASEAQGGFKSILTRVNDTYDLNQLTPTTGFITMLNSSRNSCARSSAAVRSISGDIGATSATELAVVKRLAPRDNMESFSPESLPPSAPIAAGRGPLISIPDPEEELLQKHPEKLGDEIKSARTLGISVVHKRSQLTTEALEEHNKSLSSLSSLIQQKLTDHHNSQENLPQEDRVRASSRSYHNLIEELRRGIISPLQTSDEHLNKSHKSLADVVDRRSDETPELNQHMERMAKAKKIENWIETTHDAEDWQAGSAPALVIEGVSDRAQSLPEPPKPPAQLSAWSNLLVGSPTTPLMRSREPSINLNSLQSFGLDDKPRLSVNANLGQSPDAQSQDVFSPHDTSFRTFDYPGHPNIPTIEIAGDVEAEMSDADQPDGGREREINVLDSLAEHGVVFQSLSPGLTNRGRSSSVISSMSIKAGSSRVSTHKNLEIPSAPVYLDIISRMKATQSHEHGETESKLKDIGSVVKVLTELKKAGENLELAKQTDTSTLQMILKLKKWAKEKVNAKEKERPRKEYLAAVEAQSAVDVPQNIHLNLIKETVPLIEGFVKTYRLQLGERHEYTVGCTEHLKKLQDKLASGSFTTDDLMNEEEETMAANALVLNMQHKILARSHANLGSHGSVADHTNIGSRGTLASKAGLGSKNNLGSKGNISSHTSLASSSDIIVASAIYRRKSSRNIELLQKSQSRTNKVAPISESGETHERRGETIVRMGSGTGSSRRAPVTRRSTLGVIQGDEQFSYATTGD